MKREQFFPIQMWEIARISPYPGNAKLHKTDRIAASIKQFRIDQPLVVDAEGVIIKGHGRYEAAQKLGIKEVPVIVRSDLSPEQVRLARIADNRSAEGSWDWEKLSEELNDLTTQTEGLEQELSVLGISENWWKKEIFDIPALVETQQQREPEQKKLSLGQPRILAIVLDDELLSAWQRQKGLSGYQDDTKVLKWILSQIAGTEEGTGVCPSPRKRRVGK